MAKRIWGYIGLIVAFLGIIVGVFYYTYTTINNLLWAQRASNLTDVTSNFALTTELDFDSYWDDLDHSVYRLSKKNGSTKNDICLEMQNIEAEMGSEIDKIVIFSLDDK
ncbi:MAG: hypothetical protein LKJ88_08645 [Bacilli bacterium]|jgi:hypothetical protein|nr:hypothetical protein [Bacilli bacterium]